MAASRSGSKIDHLVRLEVDQHRAVATAAPPGPIIDAKDARHRRHLSGRRADARRSSVSGLVGAEMRAARRAPASPPSARPR